MCEVDELWGDFAQATGIKFDSDDVSTISDEEMWSKSKCAAKEFFCVCGGTFVTSDENFKVCTTCGKTNSYEIDMSPEWTSGVSEDGVVSDPARCGMPSDTELFSEQWGAGLLINSRGASYEVKRMAKISFHSSMNHKDRSLFHAYNDIEKAGSGVLGLSVAIIRDAKIMYKKFNAEKLTRGAVRLGIKANCVLMACQMAKFPRTTKEVADAFGIPPKDLSRTYDLFCETILGEKVKPDTTSESSVGAEDILPRILNEFSMDEKTSRTVRMKCKKTAKHIEPCIPLMGKTPQSIASAIITIVMDGIVSKKDICEKCKISLPTLTKIETIIRQYLEANPLV